MAKNWIQSAIKHKGAFSEKAKRAGMSTREFAMQIIGGKRKATTTTKRQANLALTLMKLNKNRK